MCATERPLQRQGRVFGGSNSVAAAEEEQQQKHGAWALPRLPTDGRCFRWAALSYMMEPIFCLVFVFCLLFFLAPV